MRHAAFLHPLPRRPMPKLTLSTAGGAAAAIVIAFVVSFLVSDQPQRTSAAGAAPVGEAPPPATPRLNGVAPLPALAVRQPRRARRSPAATVAERRQVAPVEVTPAETVDPTPTPSSSAPAQPAPPAPAQPLPAPRPTPRATPQPEPESGSFDTTGEQPNPP